MQRLKLLSGYEMPVIGLGTAPFEAEDLTDAVRLALEIGYRHIDTAHLYGSESNVGAALKDCISRGVVAREDVFITSKLWITMMRPDLIRGACEQSLRSLGISYLDLYLIHAPVAAKEGDELHPKDETGQIIASDVDYVDTWKGMESLVSAGLVRSIGVSNFNRRQIQRLWDAAHIKPSVLQIEVQPYCKNLQLIAFAKSLGLQVTAFSPLGAPHHCPKYRVLDDPIVLKIAERHGRSAAQILIRYCIDNGVIAVPKSAIPKEIKENLQALEFQLTEEDISEINGIRTQQRLVDIPWGRTHRFFPFNDEN